MNSARYLVVALNNDSEDRWRDGLLGIGHRQGFDLVEGQGFLLLSSVRPVLLCSSSAQSGAIVGSIFPRGSRKSAITLSHDASRTAVETQGASLVEHFWGDYVAIVVSDNGLTILRAPFGDLPCFFHRTGGATIFSSDMALLKLASVKASIDRKAVALQLIAPDIRRRHTCLADVEELGCGEGTTAGPVPATRICWSPWHFTGPDRRCDSREAAIERLRAALLDTIAAQTADGVPNILLLSGGVDSSVAAAALSAAGRDTSALTMVTHDAAGDEREYARAVADHCGMELSEVIREPAMVDLTRSEAIDLPYPTEASFTQATRAAILSATGSSARRVLHGGGGDQIFCSLQSAAPLADLIKTMGIDRRVPQLTLDLAKVARAPATAVLHQALTRLMKRRSTYCWQPNLECLTTMAIAYEAEAMDHPWLSPPPGIGSGSAGHVALTMSALGIVQSPAWRARPPLKAILLSQPVIETCLSIPSWLWFERGRNRAIVRRAVEHLLPTGHVWRPDKGAMASFMIEIFEANRSLLRSMIGDGMLVREGLVDREACLKILDCPPPLRGDTWARLLQFADVEAWAASW